MTSQIMKMRGLMKVMDSHSHMQASQYDADREAAVLRAQEAGVGMICVGTDLDMSRKAVALAEKYPEFIWASVGLHPNDNLDEEYDEAEYEKLARHPKVVAIGEVGLDYYRTTDENQKRFQKERFLQQINLAIRMDKPLIIHCRDAHEDMTEILTNSKKENTSLRGVIHSFTGDYDQAKRYIDSDFCIGLNGIITFPMPKKNPEAHEALLDAARLVPLESILLETDAPYLTPVFRRGQRNESSYIVEVVAKLAEIRSVSLDLICETTTVTAVNLFGLKR